MSKLQLQRDGSVLLLIDIQERLAAVMPEEVLAKTVRNIKILLEAARRLGMPVVVSEQYPKGLGQTLPELTESLNGMDDLSRLEKVDFSVCASEHFSAVRDDMAGKGRTHWIVTGMETHICVYQTVRALLASGASVHVPVDAVVSRAKQNYRVGLGLVERCGAVPTSTETVVMDLLGRAVGDDFKAISKLIR